MNISLSAKACFGSKEKAQNAFSAVSASLKNPSFRSLASVKLEGGCLLFEVVDSQDLPAIHAGVNSFFRALKIVSACNEVCEDE